MLEPTPARELAAVKKARALGVPARVRRLALGRYVVPSSSDPRVTYSVTGTGPRLTDYRCSCPAGGYGNVCHHIAAVALRRVREDVQRQVARMRRKAEEVAA